MRVITGLSKGRKLKTLQGIDVRPTSAKVKQALFSIIQFDIEGRRVLDLFAGSGQLGIEALSRLSDSAVFIDSSKEAVNIIKENLEFTGLKDNALVLNTDALSYLFNTIEKFDIVFIDPPYNSELAEKSLKSIEQVLNKGAIVVCEAKKTSDFPEEIGGFSLKRYEYGNTTLCIYR
ncbi:MAG: 16S rRNA (guanine(966)-N(2))-methyltransferase RsmD [Clostridiales bacterium]|nr:16S rRNA (guanine(966)-N(2))-methyltransferase RsmD [Clostridiales bacterium]